jgi:hypothetical protein
MAVSLDTGKRQTEMFMADPSTNESVDLSSCSGGTSNSDRRTALLSETNMRRSTAVIFVDDPGISNNSVDA